ncbi:excalibur calcium-binding domain-containing protein [Streptomyces sioyaensis]|uniref:excalibur calcium-binding domain-containing protein n=1 Tax=Streptomyces sioyaensis TaxID=67364 RepID=UPI0037BA3AF3
MTEEQHNANDFETRKLIFDALRTERSNQYARNAGIGVAATALLGFEGAQALRVQQSSGMNDTLRLASFASMAFSIALLLDCLLDMFITDFIINRLPFRKKYRIWRSYRGGGPATLNLDRAKRTEILEKSEAVDNLIEEERGMVNDNREYLISRRRHRVHYAVLFYIASLCIIFTDSVITPEPAQVFMRCQEARSAGVAPISKKTEPRLYKANESLDANHNGIACDTTD